MPIISFASPKGGVGKTTAALLTATQIAQKGVGVTVIDADPEHYIEAWGKLDGKPENLHVVPSSTEDTIVDDIQEASQKSSFVIIDLEGTANKIVGIAVSCSDFVVIPIQPSGLDAKGAARALNLVKLQEKILQRRIPDAKIPHAILFTRTKAAIRTRTFVDIQAQLQKANIPVFQTQLLEREVYRSIFSFGGCLEDLGPYDAYKVEDAIQNARDFTGELLRYVKNVAVPSSQQAEVA